MGHSRSEARPQGGALDLRLDPRGGALHLRLDPSGENTEIKPERKGYRWEGLLWEAAVKLQQRV